MPGAKRRLGIWLPPVTTPCSPWRGSRRQRCRPQALVEGIDFDKLKTDYGLLGASLNGPKIWTPDWAEARIGKERDFNGIKAPWVAQLDMKKAGAVAAVTPYEPMTIARESRMGWNKGGTVMILDDAEGDAWVMKGFQLVLEPKFTYEDFWPTGRATSRTCRPAGSSGS